MEDMCYERVYTSTAGPSTKKSGFVSTVHRILGEKTFNHAGRGAGDCDARAAAGECGKGRLLVPAVLVQGVPAPAPAPKPYTLTLNPKPKT